MISAVYFRNLNEILIESDTPLKAKNLRFFEDGIQREDFFFVEESSNLYCLSTSFKINPHHLYEVEVQGELYQVNPLKLVDMPNFDEEFYYHGDLGAIYQKESTTFRVWAPISQEVILLLFPSFGSAPQRLKMNPSEAGTYELNVSGDLDAYLYQYEVKNYQTTRVSTDPYSFATLDNSQYSVVIDLKKKTKVRKHNLPSFGKPTEAIVYEVNVRDYTSFAKTDIKHKGTFLGFIEEKKYEQIPIGLSYLKHTGFTHVQLLPIHDIQTIDEHNIKDTYNWGYDPAHYFALENSYATNPRDPYAAINEFQQLVNALHRNGLRVNVDVVYNHVYRYEDSNFEKIVPGYYFRREANGIICNGSHCGNELASEKAMVSSLIIDSLIHLCVNFGVDGFRFDLLGLIDIKTMQKATKILKYLNSSIMLYGEGWEMPSILSLKERATFRNVKLLEDVGHFNDIYRDILKGSPHQQPGGYLMDDLSYYEGFKYVYCGSTVSHVYHQRFPLASESINYVECHDNETLFDYLTLRLKTKGNEKRTLKRLELFNVVNMFSFGVPFFHMGQEIGQSKKMEHNTYNAGDELNQFNYDLLSERFEYVKRFRGLVALRKRLSFLHTINPETIKELVSFVPQNQDNSLVLIAYNPRYYFEYQRFAVLINVSFEDKTFKNLDYNYYYDLNDGLKLRPLKKEMVLKESGYLILVKI